MADLVQSIQRLVLSATELKSLTGWPDALVEDYLNILDDVLRIASSVDTNNDDTSNLEADSQIAVQQSLLSIRRQLDSLEIPAAPVSRRESQPDDVVVIHQRGNEDEALAVMPLRVSRLSVGELRQGGSTTNTNTPAGATAHAQPVYDQSGALLGYVPVYGSQW